MKKLLFFIVLSFLCFSSYKVTAQTVVNVHSGYSWLNGVAGAEVQFDYLAFSIGYMPTSYPLSGDRVHSLSIAGTIYPGSYDESGLYFSGGIATGGYRYELKSQAGYYIQERRSLFIGMVGYKFSSDIGLGLKLGAGYGWSTNKSSGTTFEALLIYSFH